MAKRRTAASHERMKIISQLAMNTFDQKDCDGYKQSRGAACRKISILYGAVKSVFTTFSGSFLQIISYLIAKT